MLCTENNIPNTGWMINLSHELYELFLAALGRKQLRSLSPPQGGTPAPSK